MSVLPAWLKIEIPPEALSGTVTRFAKISPDVKLRLETVGIVVPSAKTVRKPEAVGSIAATLSTAAVAPAGTVPSPVT